MVPGGELALPTQILRIGGLANGILIRDVAISNTTIFKNTNRADDSKPSIAINPADPKEFDIFAFTAGWEWTRPSGTRRNSSNIRRSTPTIPTLLGYQDTGCPCDQTPDYGRDNRLSATFLDFDNSGIDAYSGTTTDPTSAAALEVVRRDGVAQSTDQVRQGGTDQTLVAGEPRSDHAVAGRCLRCLQQLDGAPEHAQSRLLREPIRLISTIDNLTDFAGRDQSWSASAVIPTTARSTLCFNSVPPPSRTATTSPPMQSQSTGS